MIAIGSVGTTQAALTYFSDDYRAYANVSSIRVGLVEEGELIAGGKEEYNKDNTTSYNANGVLTFPNIDKLVLGQTYDENVSARNIGDYDQYLRVHVYKSWYVKNEDGSYTKKDTKMDPSLIELTYNTKENWILDSSASTKERETLYYKTYLKSGDTTEPFIEKLLVLLVNFALLSSISASCPIILTAPFESVPVAAVAAIAILESSNAFALA